MENNIQFDRKISDEKMALADILVSQIYNKEIRLDDIKKHLEDSEMFFAFLEASRKCNIKHS